jgi:hypothetical protein
MWRLSRKCLFHSGSRFQLKTSFFSYFQFHKFFSTKFFWTSENNHKKFSQSEIIINKKLLEKIKIYSPPKLNERTEKMLIDLRNGDRRALAKAITLGKDEKQMKKTKSRSL